MAKIRIVLNGSVGYIKGNTHNNCYIASSPNICTALHTLQGMKSCVVNHSFSQKRHLVGIFFSIPIFRDTYAATEYFEQKQVLYLNIRTSFFKKFYSFYNRRRKYA